MTLVYKDIILLDVGESTKIILLVEICKEYW